MDLSHRMLQSVVAETPVSVSSGGDPTYGAARTIACRHERKQTIVRDRDGNEVVCSDVLYSYEPILVGDRLMLSGQPGALTALVVNSSPSTTGGPTLYKTIPAKGGGA